MARYIDKDHWEEEILIPNTNTPILGGQPVWEGDRLVDGFANVSAAILADRTRHLKNRIENIESDIDSDFSNFIRKDNNLSDLEDIQQAKYNLGLNLVDNVRDADKPVSGPQQEALDLKADKATTISVGSGLTGGGDLSGNISISVDFGNSSGKVTEGNDPRLSDAREWTASVVSQSEAEGGTATTARKWTAQRVRQAILGWWNNSGIPEILAGKAESSRTITAGNGLTGGGDLTANRTIALGTPSTITGNSTNSTTSTSHTHALDIGINDVSGLSSALDGKEPTISEGSSSQYWRGDKTWQTLDTSAVPEGSRLYFTESRVRDSTLSGFSAGSNTPINSGDSILTAFGKVQGQINSRITENQTITITGDASGSGKTSIDLTLANTGVTAGTYTKVTVDGKGRVTAGNSLAASDIPNLAASKITSGTLPVARGGTGASSITGLVKGNGTSAFTAAVAGVDYVIPSGNISGNAATATKLQTARTINGVAFDGTSDITINAVDSTPRIPVSEKGVANGVATLDSSGLVPASQLPSYVDDVLEFPSFSDFPATGESGKIYVAADENKVYRWTGSTYIWISASAGSSDVANKLATPRSINGTLFDGSANITTSSWGTARTLTIGNASKSVNGSGNVSWPLSEIGALPITGGTLTGNLSIDKPTDSTDSVISLTEGGGVEGFDLEYMGSVDNSFRISAIDSGVKKTAISISRDAGVNDFKYLDNTVWHAGNFDPDTKVDTTDSRLTNAREWTASTVSQAEAEAGTSTTRRAWTAQRVWQAITAWWNTSAAKSKLDGIQAGATANQTDAYLLNRANHTGTQAASTITGLAAVATSGSYNDLSDKPSFGTAASANVTTSRVDTTSGRVLKVGDFGLGLDQDSFTFPSGGSLNDLTIPGLHSVGNVAGKPDGATQALAGSCLVIRSGANGRLWQQYVETGGSGANRVWTRTRMNGGEWTPWQEFFHTGNFNPADKADVTGNVASATKLETARTINGTSFDGTADITTSLWGTARTLTIGGTSKSVNGSENVEWKPEDLQAAGVVFVDNRSVVQTPSDIPAKRISAQFKNVTAVGNPPVTSTGSYAHIISVAGWSDSSGGFPAQLSLGDGLAIRKGISSSAWGPWRKAVMEDGATWGISISGTAAKATTLATARTINGTSFDGTADITTSVWGTSRTITIGATGKSVDGSGNVSWSLSEIGAKAANWQPTTASKSQVLNGTSDAFVSGSAYHNVISWANLGNVSSGTLAIDLDNSLNFRVNVGGNITVGNPTNADPGKCGEIVITMTANGIVSWQSNWKFLNSVPNIGDSGDMWVVSYKVLDSSNVIASASKVAT